TARTACTADPRQAVAAQPVLEVLPVLRLHGARDERDALPLAHARDDLDDVEVAQAELHEARLIRGTRLHEDDPAARRAAPAAAESAATESAGAAANAGRPAG